MRFLLNFGGSGVPYMSAINRLLPVLRVLPLTRSAGVLYSARPFHKIARYEEKKAKALLGGGHERVEKQHKQVSIADTFRMIGHLSWVSFKG